MRDELETEQNRNILTPHQLFWLQQHFFPILLNCSTGCLRAQPLLGHSSHSSIFSPTDLKFLSLGLYNNLTHTYFLRASQFALNSTLWQSKLSPDIFDRMHLLFTQVHFFFWQIGHGQYVTVWIRLVRFYGISTIAGYLIPNPVFTYILNMFVNTFSGTQLKDQTVLFLTIPFSINYQNEWFQFN